MKPAPLWLAALALSLALPAAAAPRAPSAASAAAAADKLLADRSPASAGVLEQPDYLAALRAADPGKTADLVRQKLFLRDLSWLAEQYLEPGSLRQALRARSIEYYDPLWKLAGLGPQTSKLLDWVGANYGVPARARFAAALYEYGQTDDAVQAFLVKKGVTMADWQSKTFRERDQALTADGEAQEARIMAAPIPWSAEQRRDFEQRVGEILSLLPMDRQIEVNNRLTTESLLRQGLEDIQKRRLGPGGAALLAKANDPGATPLERLSALAQAYDGSPEKAQLNPEFLKALRVDHERRAPPMFMAEQRALLAQMAPGAYLRTIAQADVAGLNDYYKKHALRVVVTDVGSTAVAQYDPASHQLRLGARDIEAWLQAKGRTPRDLLTDKALFDRFILETSPVFLHECVHQQQFEGMHQDSAALHNQTFEIHAMFMQTVYTRALIKKNKAFADFVAHEQGSSNLAVMAAALQDALRRGPRYFRSYIASQWYTQFPSMAQPMLIQIDTMEALAKQVEADALARAGGTAPPRPRDPVLASRTYGAFRVATVGADLAAMRAAAAKLPPGEALSVAGGLRNDEAAMLKGYRDLSAWWKGASADMDAYWKKEYGRSAGGRP